MGGVNLLYDLGGGFLSAYINKFSANYILKVCVSYFTYIIFLYKNRENFRKTRDQKSKWTV